MSNTFKAWESGNRNHRIVAGVRYSWPFGDISRTNPLFFVFLVDAFVYQSINSWVRCMGNGTIGAYYTNV